MGDQRTPPELERFLSGARAPRTLVYSSAANLVNAKKYGLLLVQRVGRGGGSPGEKGGSERDSEKERGRGRGRGGERGREREKRDTGKPDGLSCWRLIAP